MPARSGVRQQAGVGQCTAATILIDTARTWNASRQASRSPVDKVGRALFAVGDGLAVEQDVRGRERRKPQVRTAARALTAHRRSGAATIARMMPNDATAPR